MRIDRLTQQDKDEEQQIAQANLIKFSVTSLDKNLSSKCDKQSRGPHFSPNRDSQPHNHGRGRRQERGHDRSV